LNRGKLIGGGRLRKSSGGVGKRKEGMEEMSLLQRGGGRRSGRQG